MTLPQIYVGVIDEPYLKRLEAINLPDKPENNPWLVLHKYGTGGVPRNFNVKVFKNNKGVLKMVTTDKRTLDNILEFGML